MSFALRGGAIGAWTAQRAVRTSDRLFMRTYHDGFHGLPEQLLFDLAADPHETTDLKATEPSRFAALRAQLVKHNAAIDAEGPDWWRHLGPSGLARVEGPAVKKGKKQ